jgi:signal transduction histidine kinase
VIGVAAGGLLVFLVATSFTRPLGELVNGVRALERGDFTYPLQVRGADEVSTLTSAFDRMRGRLRDTQNQLLETERLATIGQMATSISHDLRHPLTSVLAYAEFLSEPTLGEAQRRDFFQEIRIAVNRMTDELNSLLGFSKQGERLRLAPGHLEDVIERAIQNVKVLPEFERVQIRYTQEGDCSGMFDPGKMERVILNLLFNACEAVVPTAGEIEIRSTGRDDTFTVEVIDNGPGIDPAILPNLFQPFVSSGKEQGIGLGLTVVQKVVQDHGGNVQVARTGPEGTHFLLRIPARAPATAA